MLQHVIDQRRHSLGIIEVGRVLPHRSRRMVGPFVFFDHMGPAQFDIGLPREADVRPHPHIGLATISWLFDGRMMHRDSVGSVQEILPGEVNWMTAGSGITHSERFEYQRAHGGPLHGIQTWLALPDGKEEIDPSFAHIDASEVPLIDEAGMRGRLIAGSALGLTSPVPVHSPLFYFHLELQPGAAVPMPSGEVAAYVVHGELEVGADRIGPGQMAVFVPGSVSNARATQPTLIMLLGGEPVGERFVDWNFVSSSRERIEQAKADWRAGRMKLPDADDQEFIPLP